MQTTVNRSAWRIYALLCSSSLVSSANGPTSRYQSSRPDHCGHKLEQFRAPQEGGNWIALDRRNLWSTNASARVISRAHPWSTCYAGPYAWQAGIDSGLTLAVCLHLRLDSAASRERGMMAALSEICLST